MGFAKITTPIMESNNSRLFRKEKLKMDTIKTGLDDAITLSVNGLSKVELGSSEYKVLAESAATLAKQRTEIEQNESEKKERKFNRGIAIAGLVVPAVLSIAGTIISLKIEFKDNEIQTSTAGKEHLKNMIRFK